MGAAVKGRTGGMNAYGTGQVFVVFQRRPGVGSSKIIRDGGTATLYFRSGKTVAVAPVDGIYCLSLPKGEDAVLEIFGTQFRVQSLASQAPELPGSKTLSAWQAPLLPMESLTGVQQRLQILGYLTGKLTGKMDENTERAVLEFQADIGTLPIDGEAGPDTQSALEDYLTKSGMDGSGKYYLIRHYLLRFERARTGDASRACPHPDGRGGDEPVVSYGYGLTAWADRDRPDGGIGGEFNVGLDLDGMDGGLEGNLFPRFKGNGRFGWVSLKLPDGRYRAENRYEKPYLHVKSMMRGEDVLNLHYGSETGPVVGALRVKIVEMKQVMLALHLVTIEDAQGNSVPPWTEQEAMGLMDMVNAIWRPMGVEFLTVTKQPARFVGTTAGTITNDYSGRAGNREEYKELWRLNQPERINIYFCESIVSLDLVGNNIQANSNVLGFAVPRSSVNAGQPIGACVRKDKDFFNLALTVAHELGHVLDLTCHKHAHSDDDGSDTPFRCDIWSRSRLMAKFSQYDLNLPDRRWQNSTYGKTGGYLQCGAWLTSKKLARDDTDGEMEIARGKIYGELDDLY